LGLTVDEVNAKLIANDALNATFMGADDDSDDDGGFPPITAISTPAWVEVVMALTGIGTFTFSVEAEREKRADELYQNPYAEVEEIVMSLYFEAGVGVIILFNCILIGWEASIPEGEMAGFFNAFEHIFTLIFFGEWTLRILAFGWVWAFELANFADTILVFGTGVLLKWVAEPAGVNTGAFRIMTVLRALRLVRLARAVRLNPKFKEMWILIQGLTTSVIPLLWTLVIACSVLYVFAVAGVQFVGHSATFKDHELAQQLFGDFMRAMFTMLQLMTLDTYSDSVIRPLMVEKAWLGLFFVFFITVGVFIVMNLITAVIVDNAFRILHEDVESQAKDEEEKKRRDLKMLAELFMEIDVDGSGELSKEEFFGSLGNAKVGQMLALLEMKVVELTEVWDVLDDGDGLLTIKEFTDGIRRMKGDAKAKDVADVIKKLKHTDRKHYELADQAAKYSATLKALESDAKQMSDDTDMVVSLFKEMYHRMTCHIEEGEGQDRYRKKEWDKLVKLAEGEPPEEESSEEEDSDDFEKDDEGDDDDDGDDDDGDE